MKKVIEWIRTEFFSRETLIYLITGLISTAINWTVTYVFNNYLHLGYWVTSGAAFVCSLIFVPVGIGVLTAIAGLVLSILGLNTAKKMPGNKGHGLALAGTIISAIRVVLILIGLVALIALMFRGVGRVGHEIITNWQDYVPYYH